MRRSFCQPRTRSAPKYSAADYSGWHSAARGPKPKREQPRMMRINADEAAFKIRVSVNSAVAKACWKNKLLRACITDSDNQVDKEQAVHRGAIAARPGVNV